MQRIRVGLTGLAVVLLIVALASAFFTRLGPKVSPVANNATSNDEPLADLGVAPGAPANETKPATSKPNR